MCYVLAMHLYPNVRLKYDKIGLKGSMEMVLLIEKQTGASCDVKVL